jgi:hypothetical protein
LEKASDKFTFSAIRRKEGGLGATLFPPAENIVKTHAQMLYNEEYTQNRL